MHSSIRLSAILIIASTALLLSACGAFKSQSTTEVSSKPPEVLVKIDDIEALPTTSPRSKMLYRDWLTKASPRAFALSADGMAYRTWGVTTDPSVPQDVPDRAIHRCIKAGKSGCKLYAVDNSVVWTH